MTWLEIVGVLALAQYALLGALIVWWMIVGEEEEYL